MKQNKIRKRIAGLVALLGVAAFLISGTFAWQDFRQHKVNVFEGKDNPDVTLNDEYQPPKSWNTTLNSVVDKKVSVTNTANSSAPVFVRLQLSEYMESFSVDYNTFLMDPNEATRTLLFATYAGGPNIGEYLVWDTEQQAIDGLAALGLALPPYAVDDDNDAATPNKWYARTQNEELQNGVYGKPMQDPAAALTKTSESLFGGVARVPLNQDIQRGPFPYKVHTFNGKSISAESLSQGGDPPVNDYYADITDTAHATISDYIAWDMGTSVVTYAQWEQAGRPAANQWVLAADGWCYWASFLPVNTTTSNLMESVRLIAMPHDAMDYEIHIDMQAITADELSRRNEDDTAYIVWPEMSQNMRDNLSSTEPSMLKTQELLALIAHLRSLNEDAYTPESWAAMRSELEKAELLVATPGAKYDDLVKQVTDLTAAKNGLVLKADKTSLGTLITQVEALVQAGYTPASWSTLQEELAKAKVVQGNTNATAQQVNTAYSDLSTARDALVAVSNNGNLRDAITLALTYQEADWTAATWTPFNTALSAAITVRDNATATAAQIQTALTTLENARLALRADKTSLAALITQVTAYDHSALSTQTWAPVATALEAANNVNNTLQAKQGEVDAARAALSSAFTAARTRVGDTLTMANGDKWIVLTVQDGKAMVIADTYLGTRRFDENVYRGWRDSEMRGFINGITFIEAHFTEAEQTRIQTTNVQTVTSSTDSTLITTRDKFFMLSRAEVETLMTEAQRTTVNGQRAGGWWLRTGQGGSGQVVAQGIGPSTIQSNLVTAAYNIRPAMWITL